MVDTANYSVELGFDEARARLVAGRPRWLAAKLLRCELPSFVQAVRKVAAFQGRDLALELLEHTAPFLWITPEGPRQLAEPPLTRRFPNLVLLPALEPTVERQAVRLVQKTRKLLVG